MAEPMKPTSDAYNRAYARNWSGLLHRLHAHPRDASWVHKSTGMAALHVACTRNPPPKVVRELISAHPEATCLMDKTKDAPRGRTPLHLACLHGTSYEVLTILLGATPISVMRYKSKRSYIYSGIPENPIDYVHAHYSREYACRDRAARRGRGRYAFVSGIETADDLTDRKTGEFWRKVCLLLSDYSRRQRKNDDGERPFDAPPAVQRRRAPPPPEPTDPVLVLVASAAVASNDVKYGWDVRGLVIRLMDGISELITELAGIVAVPSDDEKKMGGRARYMLHNAIDCGLGWEEGVGEIVAAAPWVVSERDGVTGLFPFMMAAAATAETEEAGEDADDNLTVVWRLLLEDPSLVDVSSVRRPVTPPSPSATPTTARARLSTPSPNSRDGTEKKNSLVEGVVSTELRWAIL